MTKQVITPTKAPNQEWGVFLRHGWATRVYVRPIRTVNEPVEGAQSMAQWTQVRKCATRVWCTDLSVSYHSN